MVSSYVLLKYVDYIPLRDGRSEDALAPNLDDAAFANYGREGKRCYYFELVFLLPCKLYALPLFNYLQYAFEPVLLAKLSLHLTLPVTVLLSVFVLQNV